MHLFGCADAIAVSGKKPKPSIKLLEASYQRIIPGIPGAAIRTNYHFIVIWNSTQSPDKFFWKNEKDQTHCVVSKISTHGPNATDIIIRTGDTLSISALKDKEVQTPTGIPSKAKNTLFFKTKSSAWVPYPVKKISKKPDEAMP